MQRPFLIKFLRFGAIATMVILTIACRAFAMRMFPNNSMAELLGAVICLFVGYLSTLSLWAIIMLLDDVHAIRQALTGEPEQPAKPQEQVYSDEQ